MDVIVFRPELAIPNGALEVAIHTTKSHGFQKNEQALRTCILQERLILQRDGAKPDDKRLTDVQPPRKRLGFPCAPSTVPAVLVGVIGMALAQAAWSQSTVSLYGMLDIGVSHFTNTGGSSRTAEQSGISVPSLIGFRGSEDLSGGRSVEFDLQSLIALTNGHALPRTPNSLFDFSAWVGLTDRELGSVKLGRQFDFMNDSLLMKSLVPAMVSGGLYTSPAGPAQFAGLNMSNYGPDGGHWDWDRTGQESVKNAVKYTTPDWDGFSAGAMYGFSNNEPGAGSTISFGVNYDSGDLGIGAAYTGLRPHMGADGTDAAFQIWGTGIRYQMGQTLGIVSFTTARNTINKAAVYQASVAANHDLGTATSIAGSYTYLKGNDRLQSVHAHQLSATVSYHFSKRTTVYLGGVFQRASSGANAMINGGYAEGANPNIAEFASSNRNQGVIRVGARTFF